jgi:phytoene desaturase (3,4-didehydrolycopene-forming)
VCPQVRDGLQAAAEACGVHIRTGVEVSAISTDEAGGRATGVVLADGQQLAADIVVCNRDLAAAYQMLDQGSSGDSSSSSAGSAASPAAAAYGQQQHERLGRLKYSAGVIAFNWSVGRQLEGLLHHNIFLSDQWQQSWRPAGRPEELLQNPNFYVHVPNRTDPFAAPPGCDSVMVLLPVANQQQLGGGSSSSSSSSEGGGYAGLVEAGRQRILQTLAEAGLGDVGAAIQHETVITPPDWQQRYGLRHGAAFGLAHGLDQLSIFRWAGWGGVAVVHALWGCPPVDGSCIMRSI